MTESREKGQRVCPECGAQTEALNCPVDGEMTLAVTKKEATAADRIGQLIAGRYKIQAVIGHGGFSAVYRAQHMATSDQVAIKVLRTDIQGAQDVVARFRQEAKQTSKLKHPNTVRVFDFGQMDDGNLFLAMEFLEGSTLSALLRKESPLQPARLIHIAVQVLKALSEAHAKGLVHRDLKPDNIFLQTVHGEPDFVKVLDFGIAKSLSGDTATDMTSTGAIIGTPRYMSPEQARGQVVDHRTDLYSLAIILHEGLSGIAPFLAESPMSMLFRRVQEEPPRVHDELVLATPSGVCDVVLKALSREAAERFASADEMAAALQEGLKTAAIAPSAVGRPANLGGGEGPAGAPPDHAAGRTSGKVVVGHDADESSATLDPSQSEEMRVQMRKNADDSGVTAGINALPTPLQSTARHGTAGRVEEGSATAVESSVGLADLAAGSPFGNGTAQPAAVATSRPGGVAMGVGAGLVATLGVLAVLVLGGKREDSSAVRPAEGVTSAGVANSAERRAVEPPVAAAAAQGTAPAPVAAPAPVPIPVAALEPTGGAKLKLIVEPAEAAVEVDGAPIRGNEAALTPGSHRVRAFKAGFEEEFADLQVAAGEVHTLKLELKPSTGGTKPTLVRPARERTPGKEAQKPPEKPHESPPGKPAEKPGGKGGLMID